MATLGKLVEGKVAIVTGASRGIGRAIALKLAECGADVAINYSKSVDAAKEVQEQIEKMGQKCLLVQADVASFSRIDGKPTIFYCVYSKIYVSLIQLATQTGSVHDERFVRFHIFELLLDIIKLRV